MTGDGNEDTTGSRAPGTEGRIFKAATAAPGSAVAPEGDSSAVGGAAAASGSRRSSLPFAPAAARAAAVAVQRGAEDPIHVFATAPPAQGWAVSTQSARRSGDKPPRRSRTQRLALLAMDDTVTASQEGDLPGSSSGVLAVGPSRGGASPTRRAEAVSRTPTDALAALAERRGSMAGVGLSAHEWPELREIEGMDDEDGALRDGWGRRYSSTLGGETEPEHQGGKGGDGGDTSSGKSPRGRDVDGGARWELAFPRTFEPRAIQGLVQRPYEALGEMLRRASGENKSAGAGGASAAGAALLMSLVRASRDRLRRERGAEGAVLRLRAAKAALSATTPSGQGGRNSSRGGGGGMGVGLGEMDARPGTAQSYLGEAGEARLAVMEALEEIGRELVARSPAPGMLQVVANVLFCASEVAVAELERLGLTKGESSVIDMHSGQLALSSANTTAIDSAAMPPRGLYVTVIERASIQRGMLEKGSRHAGGGGSTIQTMV